MMRKPIFCNNCGKQGHVYNQCKMPITSIGVIVFRKRKGTNELEYLMIRRKDSLGYVDFVRGNYTLTQKQHLKNLVEEMTVEERKYLMDRRNTFHEIWKSMWGSLRYYNNRQEELNSKKKFDSLREEGVVIQEELVTLESLISEITTTWTEPEWGFPKGRRNYQERDLMCGFREFEEETGFVRENLNVMSNILPFEEIYTGSNYKTYKNKYFVALYENTSDETTTFQKTEVSKMRWSTYSEALRFIRPYSEERLDILRKIHTMLNKYSIVG